MVIASIDPSMQDYKPLVRRGGRWVREGASPSPDSMRPSPSAPQIPTKKSLHAATRKVQQVNMVIRDGNGGNGGTAHATAASTLLQAVYRVVKCVCGFRSFLEVSESLEL